MDLAILNNQQQHTDEEWDELEKQLNAYFEASWKTLLNRQVEQARQILAKLFGGERVPFIPTRLGYEFSGVACVGSLLIGGAKALVSQTGLEGFCKGISSSWGIPFQGFVEAA